MKKSFLKFQIASAIFVIILGTILHFTYEWSGENEIVGIFSAVNESTWEHLKLVFFPTLITIIVGCYLYGKKIICAKTVGVVTALLFTVVFFYTYTGIIGTNYAILNIATFVVSAVLTDYIAYQIFTKNIRCSLILSIIALIVLLISFICFTYNPPQINLFKDPITGMYGIRHYFWTQNV